MGKFWKNILDGWNSTLDIFPNAPAKHRYVNRKASQGARIGMHWAKVGRSLRKAALALEKEIGHGAKESAARS